MGIPTGGWCRSTVCPTSRPPRHKLTAGHDFLRDAEKDAQQTEEVKASDGLMVWMKSLSV